MILGLSGLILGLRAYFGPGIDIRPRRVDLRSKRANLGPVKAGGGLIGPI